MKFGGLVPNGGDLSLPRQKQVARDAGRRIERAVLVCGGNI